MKFATCAVLTLFFGLLGCDSGEEPVINYKDILGSSEMVNIWIQAAGRTWDGTTYKPRLNSCFENKGSSGKCGRRILGSEFYPDSVSIGDNSTTDELNKGRTTECPKEADGAMPWGTIYEMVCYKEIVSAKPKDTFYIDVNFEGSAKIVMPIWPNPAKDYLSVSLPVEDQNVFLSKVSDADPLELMWDKDTEDGTTISWALTNLSTDPTCIALDYGQMHAEGLPDSGSYPIMPKDHTYPAVMSPLPPKGCAALLRVTRVFGGTNITNIEGIVEARVTSERAIVILE